MKQIRQKFKVLQNKIKPDQTMEDTLIQEMEEDNFPSSFTPNIGCNQVAYSIISKGECCTAYTDLTRRFPQKSSQGNQYLLIGYHYDTNCILALPLKDRTATSITKMWSKLHNIFKQAGQNPSTYVLDNEISVEFTQTLQQNNTTY